MKYPLVHCKEDDEKVCKVCLEKNAGVYYLAIEGTQCCPSHGGNKQLESIRKEASNQYRLQQWQQRVREFTESDHVKSLRSEIGILKMILESVLNQCTDAHSLMLHSLKISNLVKDIEKVVVSCDRLEKNMGMMLDKSTAMKLAADIVDLISLHVDDPNVIDAISNGIIDKLKEL